MTITLDTWAFCKLLEGGWYGSHLTNDILEKAITLWWPQLSTEERRAVYTHFEHKELDPPGSQKRLLQEHLMTRYAGSYDYVVTNGTEELQVYRFGDHFHLSPTTRVEVDLVPPPDAPKPWTRHVAGVPCLGLQGCVECGLVLVDHAGAMVPAGGPPPGFWEPGAVYNKGNMWVREVGKREKVVECSRSSEELSGRR